MNDEFGARMKDYEAHETERKFLPYIPVYARIDGRSFSKFTRTAIKPFDQSITSAMLATTTELIKQTHARIGYTQSDEISLVWLVEQPHKQMFFNGKIQKMCSVLSGIATAAFIKYLVNDADWNERQPSWLNRLPHFDTRVLQLPSKMETANMFLWREADARKNAITMVASAYFSHKQLQGKNSSQKLEMLADKGIDFEQFPTSLRQGTFIRSSQYIAELSDEQFSKIPEHKRPVDRNFVRSHIIPIDVGPFHRVTNRVGFIFDGEAPITS